MLWGKTFKKEESTWTGGEEGNLMAEQVSLKK